MKYLGTFTIKPEHVKEAIAQFKQTGGAPPPGVTLIGRWHVTGTGRGFTLIESDDPVAMSKFALAWSDLLEQTITPVVDDAQLAAALS